jgi:hypothetical protein
MPYPTSGYSGNLCIYDTPHNAIVYTVNYETCSDLAQLTAAMVTSSPIRVSPETRMNSFITT